MARIEYSGVPDQQPSLEAPNDYQHIDAPAGAFGANVAKGLQGVGGAALDIDKFWGQVQTDQGMNDANGEATKVVENFKNYQGQDALDHQAETEQSLKEIYETRRGQLSSAEQKLNFDNGTRSFYQRFLQPQVYTHANQQELSHANTVNENGFKLGLDTVASLDPQDPDYENKATDAIHTALVPVMRNAHLKFGANASDDDISGYVRPYQQALLKTQAQIMAVKDPQGASDFLDKNRQVIGVDYPELSSRFKTAANQQRALGVANDAFTGVAQNLGAVPEPDKSSMALRQAILQQESGNSNAVPTSVAGAVGPGQMTPATFGQYAKPGEDINNPADNRAVSARYIEALSKMPNINGDPQRVAVAYFSGPGNVAPANSPTPWVTDAKDGNGKSVSSYVSDVTQRLGTQGPLLAARASVYDRVMAATEGNPAIRQAALKEVDQRYRASEIADLQDQKARKDAQDANLRHYGDTIRAGKPDFSYRDNPNLTEENVEHLEKLNLDTAKEAVDGKPGNWGPGYDAIEQRIAHPAVDGGIRNQEQLMDAYAKGDLNTTGLEKATKVLADMNKPGAEEDQRLLADFYKEARAKVTLQYEDEPGIKVADAGQKWVNARIALDKAIDAGRHAGKTTADMISSTSKDSVWPVLGEPGGPYLPSAVAKTKAALQDDVNAAMKNGAAGQQPDWKSIKTDTDAVAAWEKLSPNERAMWRPNFLALVSAHPEWGIPIPSGPAGGPPSVPNR